MDLDKDTSADKDSDDQTANDAEAAATQEARDIASSENSSDWLDDDQATQSPEALDDGNSDKDDASDKDDKSDADPDSKQPEGDETDKDDKTEDDKTDKTDNSDSKTEGDEAPTPEQVAEAEAEELAGIREASGLPSLKGDGHLEEVETKYRESSKEVHRLVDANAAQTAALAEVGVQLIEKDGKFAVAPTDKYQEELDVSADSRIIFDQMPKDLQDGVESDEARANIVEHVIKEANKLNLSRRPSVNASTDDIRLSDDVVNNIFSEMSRQKLGKGETERSFYADLEDDAVSAMMSEHYGSPAARDFMVAANKSQENMTWFLGALHGIVQRGRAPILAAKRDAEIIAEKAKTVNRQDASIGGSGESGKDSAEPSADQAAKDEANAIASSEGTGW